MDIIIDNEIYYTYEVMGRKHILSYSNSDSWAIPFRGEVAMILTNTGNGFKLDKATKVLDYQEAEQLLILLKLTAVDREIFVADKTKLK